MSGQDDSGSSHLVGPNTQVANSGWTGKPPPGNKESQTKDTSINRPEPYEQFLLAEGEKKVEEKIDTRMPNTSYFHFNKEDHTLGNLFRDKLVRSPHVLFAAYRVPHPLFPTVELRVQTDGEITPKEALVACSRELITELDTFWRNFKREYDLRKMVQQDQSGA